MCCASASASAFANCMPWHVENAGKKRGKYGESGSGSVLFGGVNWCAEVLYLRDKISQPKAFNHR